MIEIFSLGFNFYLKFMIKDLMKQLVKTTFFKNRNHYFKLLQRQAA